MSGEVVGPAGGALDDLQRNGPGTPSPFFTLSSRYAIKKKLPPYNVTQDSSIKPEHTSSSMLPQIPRRRVIAAPEL